VVGAQLLRGDGVNQRECQPYQDGCRQPDPQRATEQRAQRGGERAHQYLALQPDVDHADPFAEQPAQRRQNQRRRLPNRCAEQFRVQYPAHR
jgi:hypothetical protein